MKTMALVFLPLCALGLQAQPVVVGPQYSISPTTTDAGRPFTLQLLAYNFSCANRYSHQNVNISGQTITLTFVTTVDSMVACVALPSIYIPYGPTFSLSALARGTYTVQAAAEPACMFSNPMCLIAQPAPQFAGTLTVKDSSTKIWIDPNPITAGTYGLVVKSRGFYCNDRFGISSNAQVKDHNLILAFSYTRTLAACPVPDTAIKSVEFLLPTLAAGTYPVLWQPDSTCTSSGLACTTEFRTVGFDTLTVTATSAIKTDRPGDRTLRRTIPGSPESLRGYLLNGRKPKFRHQGAP